MTRLISYLRELYRLLITPSPKKKFLDDLRNKDGKFLKLCMADLVEQAILQQQYHSGCPFMCISVKYTKLPYDTYGQLRVIASATEKMIHKRINGHITLRKYLSMYVCVMDAPRSRGFVATHGIPFYTKLIAELRAGNESD